jgi:hypothetical protein
VQNAGAQLLDETQGTRVHLEFMPNDAPDPDAQVSIPPEQITTELLKLCEESSARRAQSSTPSYASSSQNAVTTAVSAGSSTPSASPRSIAPLRRDRPSRKHGDPVDSQDGGGDGVAARRILSCTAVRSWASRTAISEDTREMDVVT